MQTENILELKAVNSVCDEDSFEMAKSENLVLAVMTKQEYEDFVEINLDESDWSFDVCLIDNDIDSQRLVDIINENQAQVLITSWATMQIPDDIARKAPSLRYIAHIFGTVKPFLPRKVIEDGILVTNWGNTAARDVAEHCLLQTLACLRRLTKCHYLLHTRKQWRQKEFPVSSLFMKKVGIYGTGRCAQEYAKLLQTFDCSVSMFSRSIPDYLDSKIHIAGSLDELFSENEVVAVLESANDETYKAIDYRLLDMICDNGVFINSARGSIVDQDALAQIAYSKNIQIAIDVYDPEPLAEDSALRDCENVLLTPHIAGPTAENRKFCSLFCLNNIQAYFDGLALDSVVDVDDYDRMSEN